MTDETLTNLPSVTEAPSDELTGLRFVEPFTANLILDAVELYTRELSDNDQIAEFSPAQIANLVIDGLAQATENLTAEKVAEYITKRRQFS